MDPKMFAILEAYLLVVHLMDSNVSNDVHYCSAFYCHIALKANL